jgi:protein involved in polysaccharide export with SLBB domain
MNNLKICLSVLVVFLCCLAYNPVSAQSQSLQSLSGNINVDNVSDAQIKSWMQQAQALGYSDDQLAQMARNKGMSDDQIQKLQQRVDEIRKNEGNTNNTNNTSNLSDTSGRQQSRRINYNDTTRLRRQKDLNNLKSKIFGADLFRNSNSNTFQPDLKLAIPVNYIVGPDDQLHINVYGKSVASWDPVVSPEGEINIKGIGVLNVGGKTIEQVTADIKGKLAASNYAIGKGTSVQVALGNIRSIRVFVQGQVVKPGAYTLSSLSTVIAALYAAGGPGDNGSFRQITLTRNNHKIRTIDLYDYITTGSHKDDITLQDQDVVVVPTYRTHVELTGEVKIPAIFEPLPGETLQDIINFAGGFTDTAYTAKITVIQVSDQQKRIADILENDYKSYVPLSGDKYIVQQILKRFENRVTINGAVFRPGQYELQKGLTISQLIKNAAGLKEDAFMDRGSIIRLNPDNSTQALSFNVKDALNNEPSANFPLQREDIVTISSIFDLHDKYHVTISGEVRKPGDFAYADSMRVGDLIIKAGGFTEGASITRIEVSRRVSDSDPTKLNSQVSQVFPINVDANLKEVGANFILKPFDIVSIYSLPGYETQKQVKVEGEVIYPGYYTIQKKNEKISDILIRAGGLTASADIDGANLKRDNEAASNDTKTKIDTAAINRERIDRLKRLQRAYKDSTNTDSSQLRNNFIGIDLRKILKTPGTGEDLILENGDVLRIPKQLQTVKINGEVLFPSAVVYNGGKSFRDYVLNAGGYSPIALKRGAYIVYPNGTVRGTRKFLFFNVNPRVRPGSEIYVPKKPITKDNLPEFIALTTSIMSMGAILLGVLELRR